ncbi:Speg isoform C [Columba livia]|nr:Speg isoform C [Columba livia]
MGLLVGHLLGSGPHLVLLPSAPSTASSWMRRGDARALDCGQGLAGWLGEAEPRRVGGVVEERQAPCHLGQGSRTMLSCLLHRSFVPVCVLLPLSLLPREGEQGAEPTVATMLAKAVEKGLQCGDSSATVTLECGGQETLGTSAGQHPVPAAEGRESISPFCPGTCLATVRHSLLPQGSGSTWSPGALGPFSLGRGLGVGVGCEAVTLFFFVALIKSVW